MVYSAFMRKFIFILLAIGLMSAGCTADSSKGAYAYVTFVINTHDWVNPQASADTLKHIVDLHEKYNIPVDIYLTDPIARAYEKDAPDLIKRLKTSSLVAVSYHTRPPTPYYSGFHEELFDGLSNQALYDALYKYETHALDLSTGGTTDEAGGYAHLKDMMGYAPFVVTDAVGNTPLNKTLARIYKDMGAIFSVSHGDDLKLGMELNGLLIRPETVEVKAYEKIADGMSAGDILAEALSQAKAADADKKFINLKWHEQNFYSTGTPWAGPYYLYVAEGGSRHGPLNAPYDLSRVSLGWAWQDEATQAKEWAAYEDLLKAVSAEDSVFLPVNAKGIEGLL